MSSNNQRRFGGWGRRYLHRDVESLMVRCLRDGSLDVDLETGKVWTWKRGDWCQPVRTRRDEDGYVKFTLSREAPPSSRKRRDRDGRRREHMTVFVHRLVMVKKIAIAANEERWRNVVRDLPGSTEVHHKDEVRHHNWSENLTLELSEIHRTVVHGHAVTADVAEPLDF